jgi:hypothetical protein
MEEINRIEALWHAISQIEQGYYEDAIDVIKQVAKELDELREG